MSRHSPDPTRDKNPVRISITKTGGSRRPRQPVRGLQSHRLPAAIRITAGSPPRGLRLAVDVDGVGVLTTGHAVLLRGRSRHDRAIAAGVRIAPRHRRAGGPTLQSLHLRRIGTPLVLVVHGSADAVAEHTPNGRA